MKIIDKELKLINQDTDSLYTLNQKILDIGKGLNWYFVINRVNKVGWIVYGLENGGKQIRQEVGLNVLSRYFTETEIAINRFVELK